VSELRRPARPTPGAQWDGLVVLCAGNNWDDGKLADQHLAQHLSGHLPLLYVDPPISHLTPLNHPDLADSVRRPRLRLLTPRLARFTPIMPPRGETLIPSVAHALVRRSLTRAVARLGGRVNAVVAAAPAWPVFGTCGERLRVFWAQDDYAGGAELMGLDPQRVLRGELAAAASADLIVASSAHVRDAWVARGYAPTLIPFGCDAGRFAQAGHLPQPDDIRLDVPVAGFVGHINERIDIRLLEATVDCGMSLLLVGPLDPKFEPSRMAALLARPNVCWVGEKPFEDLPPYLGALDVGLVPYTRSQFNMGSFPLKTLEYLSAGLRVVSTDLPATRWLATDLVAIESSPAGFVEAARRAVGMPRATGEILRRQRFAAAHDWSCRAADWAQALCPTGTAPLATSGAAAWQAASQSLRMSGGQARA